MRFISRIADELPWLLIVGLFLLLMGILPWSAENGIQRDCDDFGRFRVSGQVYTCQKVTP